MLVRGGGDERGAPLHLVKILPLGSFHAPPADPSRKCVCVWVWVKNTPQSPSMYHGCMLSSNQRGQSVLSLGESESAVCDQRDMGNRTACHTCADACIF